MQREAEKPLGVEPITSIDVARRLPQSRVPGKLKNTWLGMLFGDAKEVVGELARQLAARSNASRMQAA